MELHFKNPEEGVESTGEQTRSRSMEISTLAPPLALVVLPRERRMNRAGLLLVVLLVAMTAFKSHMNHKSSTGVTDSELIEKMMNSVNIKHSFSVFYALVNNR